jgi:hypothetical protein
LKVSKLNRSKNLRTEDPLKTKKKLSEKKEPNKGKKRKKYIAYVMGATVLLSNFMSKNQSN